MNSPEPNQTASQLNVFLDGRRGPVERAALERHLAADPELRAEFELQRAIERRLQKRFQPPAVPPLDVLLSHPESRPTTERGDVRRPAQPPRNRPTPKPRPSGKSRASGMYRQLDWPRIWQVAGLILVASVAWLVVAWNLFPSIGRQVVFAERPLADVFAETVDHGFEPDDACEDDERLRATIYARHGQAIQLGPLPDGRTIVGLAYVPSISRHSTALLAHVGDQPVMVFIDKLSRDRSIGPPSASDGLRMFRRELEGLVMYEITPFDEPFLLPFFLLADPPPDDCLTD